MKVTVNFGTVRVIVPCGSGDLLVSQLMELAITRYKKATGKNFDVIIHNLKVSSDGGILDPDDTLIDVADDKEQIVASFEENCFPLLPHHGGDGTSASSVGTESPDFLQKGEFFDTLTKKAFCVQTPIGMLPLHVRRGSEPVLNHISPLPSLQLHKNASKRWSAEIMVDEDNLKKIGHYNISSKSEECIKFDSAFLFDEREDGSGEERSILKHDERKEPLGGPLVSPKLESSNQKMNYDCAFQGSDPSGWIDCHAKCNIEDKAVNTVPEKDSSLNVGEFSEVLMLKSKLLTPTKKIFGYCKTPSSTHSSLRKVGRRILIHLDKGSIGLGFSISSSETGGPLFIKNILPAGAAIEDGRLKVGDRILEVNRIDVSKTTQAEVVELLRQVPFGKSVELIVSRPEADNSPSPHLPRQMPPEQDCTAGIFHWKKREVFTFNIPLNDTGAAGLGVSVKGKTSATTKGTADMGIFVKSVIHGGAASKDGRLLPNDQLLNINGISLLTGSNSQAMETLRRAVIQGEGPNAISLTIARRIPSPPLPASYCDENSDNVCHKRNDSLLSESGDSFYVSNENISSAAAKSKDNAFANNSQNAVICKSDLLPSHELNFDYNLAELENNSCMEPLMNFEWHGPERTIEQFHPLNNGDSFIKKLTLMDVGVDEHYMFSNDSENCNIPGDNNYLKQKLEVIEQQKKDIYGRTTFTRHGRTRQSMPEKVLHYSTCQEKHREAIYNQCMKTCNIKRDGTPSGTLETFKCADPLQNRKTLTDSINDQISNSTDSHEGHVVHSGKTGSCHSPGCPYHITGINDHSNQCLSSNTGPILGMQKSSSMESLQTLIHEKLRLDKDCLRGCNDSFRAAVDRSYEASYCNGNQTSKNNGHKTFTSRPHVRSATVGAIAGQALAQEKGLKQCKKKGLLKGLGSVFRFGKSKKTYEECQPESKDKKFKEDKHIKDKKSITEQNKSSVHVPSRQERMNFLRVEHQRRHQQRNGNYPQEHKEELYEEQIKKMLDKKDMGRRPLPPLPHQIPLNKCSQDSCSEPPISSCRNYEIYKEMSKPGSRRGFADPDRYCHYVNFQEIQHQLQHFKTQIDVPDPPKAPSKHSLFKKSHKPFRHTLSSHRTQLATDFFEKDLTHIASKRSTGVQSLPRQSFSSSRQRLPIPAYMMAASSKKEDINRKTCLVNKALSRRNDTHTQKSKV